ncbi:MAG: relaxase domain-containing protein [Actinomycetia bacterium]|nr:relaxase domain-containing protein [Actinomycetes bacterium]
MTARVTTLKGPEAGAYYVEALPNYYLDSGEPFGRWYGRAAAELGLSGTIEADDFLAVMAGENPLVCGQFLGRHYGDSSVRGFDVTCSAPKSVSVLFALSDQDTRQEVLTAHDEAVATTVRWIEQSALTRHRINGEVAVVDAEGLIAGTFRQHTSRSLDPQLHTHVVIASKVTTQDGRWLALDARGLKLDQRTVSAIYHASLQRELSRRLGVEWRATDHSIAEIDGVSQDIIDTFSTRTASVQRRIDQKLDRFNDSMGHEPTPRERWTLEREAVLDSRPAKAKIVDGPALHDEWRTRLVDLGISRTELLADTLSQASAAELHAEVHSRIIDRAIANLEESQSTWRPAELMREIAHELPTDIGLEPSDLMNVLDILTTQAIAERCTDISRPGPAGVILRADGRPITESIADRALTTPAILDQEARLLDWAQRRMAQPGFGSAAAAKAADTRLTVPQAETAAAVAGTGDLVLVVGPAGTGKTTALAPAVEQLRADGRSVFGVAPSAVAEQVLEAETGVYSDTLDKLLVEHDGRRPPTSRYDLPIGTTILVDEAGMVPTDRLAALAELADTRAWRVALIGDPMQFSAVGRGGAFGHLVNTHGAIELDRVHRFDNQWERDASLLLRRGDQSVADLYELHGRIHGGTGTRMEADAVAAWDAARRRGESVLLSGTSNETVHQLNHAAQQLRIDNGELSRRGGTVEANGYRFQVGDQIVTRRNDRQLVADQDTMVRNRATWTIDNIRRGTITATGDSGTICLPAGYVNEHVHLGYAQTSHATQGRTVDRSILVLNGPTDVRGLYVPLTRGRISNDAYVTVNALETATDIFRSSMTKSWIDRPAHARMAELADHQPGTLPVHVLRALFNERSELREIIRHIDGDIPRHHHTLEEQQTALDRPITRRWHRDEIRTATVDLERSGRAVSDAEADHANAASLLSGVRGRIDDTNHRAPDRPLLEHRLKATGEALNTDAAIRGIRLAEAAPPAITAAIGGRPHDAQTSKAWEQAAGRLEQFHLSFGEVRGLGPSSYFHPANLADGRQRAEQAMTSLGREYDRLNPSPTPAIGHGHGMSR